MNEVYYSLRYLGAGKQEITVWFGQTQRNAMWANLTLRFPSFAKLLHLIK